MCDLGGVSMAALRVGLRPPSGRAARGRRGYTRGPMSAPPPAPRQGVVRQGDRDKAWRPLTLEQRREAFETGLAAYARGDFFAAHEALEPAWMGTDDLVERALHQGLIKVAAAYVHAVRHNPAGHRQEPRRRPRPPRRRDRGRARLGRRRGRRCSPPSTPGSPTPPASPTRPSSGGSRPA